MGAATQARRLDPDLEIVVAEKGRYTSYSACGLPYLVAGDVDSVDDLVVRTPAELRSTYRIDVRTRHEVVAIDLDRRTAEVRDLERDRTIRLPFDQLMIGTGARPVRPDLPGIDEPWVHGIQTLEDGRRAARGGRAGRCRDVIIVGGRLHRPRDGRGLPPAGRTGHARRRQRPRDGPHPRPRPR